MALMTKRRIISDRVGRSGSRFRSSSIMARISEETRICKMLSCAMSSVEDSIPFPVNIVTAAHRVLIAQNVPNVLT